MKKYKIAEILEKAAPSQWTSKGNTLIDNELMEDVGVYSGSHVKGEVYESKSDKNIRYLLKGV